MLISRRCLPSGFCLLFCSLLFQTIFFLVWTNSFPIIWSHLTYVIPSFNTLLPFLLLLYTCLNILCLNSLITDLSRQSVSESGVSSSISEEDTLGIRVEYSPTPHVCLEQLMVVPICKVTMQGIKKSLILICFPISLDTSG